MTCSNPSVSDAAAITPVRLGLSIARQSVRAHGGDIHTRNTPGEGCIFTVDVPLAAVGVSVVQGTPNVR